MKKGDLVVAQGHQAVFIITRISKDGETADIERFSVSKHKPMGYKETGIPTSTLSPFKEDASQAAARIVKEATTE